MTRRSLVSKVLDCVFASLGFTSSAQATLPAAPPQWTYSTSSVGSGTTPSFSAWPSITIPAVAGAQHVLNCVSFTVGMSSTQSAGAYTVLQLLDGTSTSTKVLMQRAFFPSTTSQHIGLCGLNVTGSVNNAMTLVFTNGGGYYGFNQWDYAALNLNGFDAQ